MKSKFFSPNILYFLHGFFLFRLNDFLFFALFCFFTTILFVSISDKTENGCNNKDWATIRIVSITISLIFLMIGLLLWKKYRKRLIDVFSDLEKNINNVRNDDSEIENSHSLENEYIIHFQRIILKTDEKIYCLWSNIFILNSLHK